MDSEQLPKIATVRTLGNGIQVLELSTASVFITIPVTDHMLQKICDDIEEDRGNNTLKKIS